MPVRRSLSAVDVPVQLGGGIRDMATLGMWLEQGVARVILAPWRWKTPRWCARPRAPSRSGRGRGSTPARDSWRPKAGPRKPPCRPSTSPAASRTRRRRHHLHRHRPRRRAPWPAPNIPATEALARAVSIPVIASGGVSTMDDLRALQATGVNAGRSAAGRCTRARSIWRRRWRCRLGGVPDGPPHQPDPQRDRHHPRQDRDPDVVGNPPPVPHARTITANATPGAISDIRCRRTGADPSGTGPRPPAAPSPKRSARHHRIASFTGDGAITAFTPQATATAPAAPTAPPHAAAAPAQPRHPPLPCRQGQPQHAQVKKTAGRGPARHPARSASTAPRPRTSAPAPPTPPPAATTATPPLRAPTRPPPAR